jgi:hypothetical protein
MGKPDESEGLRKIIVDVLAKSESPYMRHGQIFTGVQIRYDRKKPKEKVPVGTFNENLAKLCDKTNPIVINPPKKGKASYYYLINRADEAERILREMGVLDDGIIGVPYEISLQHTNDIKDFIRSWIGILSEDFEKRFYRSDAIKQIDDCGSICSFLSTIETEPHFLRCIQYHGALSKKLLVKWKLYIEQNKIINEAREQISQIIQETIVEHMEIDQRKDNQLEFTPEYIQYLFTICYYYSLGNRIELEPLVDIENHMYHTASDNNKSVRIRVIFGDTWIIIPPDSDSGAIDSLEARHQRVISSLLENEKIIERLNLINLSMIKVKELRQKYLYTWMKC